MTMVNQAHVEAICSATYLEDYLDCLDSLPDELQRILTQIREVDLKLYELEKETIPFDDMFSNLKDGEMPDSKYLSQMQRTLLRMQEFEDEKIQLSGSLMEFIENRMKQLEADRENLDPANHMVNDNNGSTRSGNNNNKKSANDTKSSSATTSSSTQSADKDKHDAKQIEVRSTVSSAKKRKQKQQPDTTVNSGTKSNTTGSKSAQTGGSSTNNNSNSNTAASTRDNRSSHQDDHTPAKKQASSSSTRDRDEEKSATKQPPKRKRRSRAGTQAKSHKEIIKEPSPEPEEPTYCLCNQISYGEMIGCDNDACPIEWFHFNCVGLNNKPKGRWYCPKCRGDKPTVMKRHR